MVTSSIHTNFDKGVMIGPSNHTSKQLKHSSFWNGYMSYGTMGRIQYNFTNQRKRESFRYTEQRDMVSVPWFDRFVSDIKGVWQLWLHIRNTQIRTVDACHVFSTAVWSNGPTVSGWSFYFISCIVYMFRIFIHFYFIQSSAKLAALTQPKQTSRRDFSDPCNTYTLV